MRTCFHGPTLTGINFWPKKNSKSVTWLQNTQLADILDQRPFSRVMSGKVFFTNEIQKPTSLPTRSCVWEALVLHPVQAWKDKIKWCWETRYLKDLDWIDGEPTEFEWNRVEKISRIHYIGNSRWDSKDDGGIKVGNALIFVKRSKHIVNYTKKMLKSTGRRN